MAAMTGQDHYERAGRLAVKAHDDDSLTDPQVTLLLMAAQVHANLAIAWNGMRQHERDDILREGT
jgi:hypothetical protein